MKTLSHVFRGKRYHIQFVNPKELQDKEIEDDMVCLGKCDPPDLKDSKIKIDNTLVGKEKLRVIIHECLHASDFSMPEYVVDEVSTCIAGFLWKLGYKET